MRHFSAWPGTSCSHLAVVGAGPGKSGQWSPHRTQQFRARSQQQPVERGGVVNIQAVTAPAPGLLLSLINYISFSVTFSHAHFSLVRPHFPRVLHTETPLPLPSTQGIIDIDHYPQPQQINCQPVQLFCLHKVETIVLKHILKQMSDDEQMLCVYKMWKVIKRSG